MHRKCGLQNQIRSFSCFSSLDLHASYIVLWIICADYVSELFGLRVFITDVFLVHSFLRDRCYNICCVVSNNWEKVSAHTLLVIFVSLTHRSVEILLIPYLFSLNCMSSLRYAMFLCMSQVMEAFLRYGPSSFHLFRYEVFCVKFIRFFQLLCFSFFLLVIVQLFYKETSVYSLLARKIFLCQVL